METDFSEITVSWRQCWQVPRKRSHYESGGSKFLRNLL